MPLGIIPLNAEPPVVGQILHLAENLQMLSESFIPSGVSSPYRVVAGRVKKMVKQKLMIDTDF